MNGRSFWFRAAFEPSNFFSPLVLMLARPRSEYLWRAFGPTRSGVSGSQMASFCENLNVRLQNLEFWFESCMPSQGCSCAISKR